MGDYSAKQSSSSTGLGWLLRAHVRFWVEEEVKEGADDKGNVKKGDENAEMRITAQDGISSDYHLSRLMGPSGDHYRTLEATGVLGDLKRFRDLF